MGTSKGDVMTRNNRFKIKNVKLLHKENWRIMFNIPNIYKVKISLKRA